MTENIWKGKFGKDAGYDGRTDGFLGRRKPF